HHLAWSDLEGDVADRVNVVVIAHDDRAQSAEQPTPGVGNAKRLFESLGLNQRHQPADDYDRCAPALSCGVLDEVLGERYGLAVVRCEPGPRGWTGETYSVTTAEGERLFVKVFPRDRLPPTVEPALPVLAEMHRLGLRNISHPLPTISGALSDWLGDDMLVVYEY